MTWTPIGDKIPIEYLFPTITVGDILIGRQDDALVAWRFGEPTALWRHTMPQKKKSRTEFVSDGTRVVTYGKSRKPPYIIDCCAVASGALLWRTKLDVSPGEDGLAFWGNSVLVRGSTKTEAMLVALDIETGAEQARQHVPGGLGVYVVNGRIFFKGFRKLYHLTEINAAPRELPNEDSGIGGCIVDGDELVCLTGRRGGTEVRITRLTADGSPLSSVQIPSKYLGMRNVLLGNGRIVFFPFFDDEVQHPVMVDTHAGEIVWTGEAVGVNDTSVRAAVTVGDKLVACLIGDKYLLRTWDSATGAHLDDTPIDAYYTVSSINGEVVGSLGLHLQRFVWATS